MLPQIINTKKGDPKVGAIFKKNTIGIKNTGSSQMYYDIYDSDLKENVRGYIDAYESVNFPAVLNYEYFKLRYDATLTDCEIIAI